MKHRLADVSLDERSIAVKDRAAAAPFSPAVIVAGEERRKGRCDVFSLVHRAYSVIGPKSIRSRGPKSKLQLLCLKRIL